MAPVVKSPMTAVATSLVCVVAMMMLMMLRCSVVSSMMMMGVRMGVGMVMTTMGVTMMGDVDGIKYCTVKWLYMYTDSIMKMI